MLGRKEEQLHVQTKLKTEEKAMTLQQIRTDVSNFGKICLNSGLKIEFGKPVRFPIIRRRKMEASEECYSSRTSNQTQSQLNIRMGVEKEQPEDVQPDRSSSLLTKTIEKENTKGHNKERSLDTGKQTQQQQELIEYHHKKALPKIFRHKYFRDAEKVDRVKSDRNALKTEESESLQKYKLGVLLGQGSNATVRIGQSTSGELVAVKTYDKSKLKEVEKRENVKRQVELLSRLNHPNIVHFIEAIETSHSINIVTELLENTSLLDLLKNSVTGKLEQHEARPLFRQLVSALHYLHNLNILHRDIKLENALLTKDHHVKLIDLGFSIESTAKLNIFCGTPSYIAPEVIQKKGYLGKPADVWSCGILLYKILCGVFPFKGINQKTLYNKISKGVFRFVGDISMNAQILINRMLTSDPTARATLDEVLREPWMLEKF